MPKGPGERLPYNDLLSIGFPSDYNDLPTAEFYNNYRVLKLKYFKNIGSVTANPRWTGTGSAVYTDADSISLGERPSG